MKTCLITITPQLLAELLQLPREAEIVDIRSDIEMVDMITIRLVGVGEDVAPSQRLSYHSALCTTRRTTDFKWSFDEQTN